MQISASVLLCFVFTLSSNAATLPSYGFVAAPQPANLPGTSATIADFNGDGNPDIISVSASTSEVSICFGDGQGNFGSPISVPASPGAYSVSVADLNGDGYLDLVVHVAATPESIQILLGNSTGSFRVAGSFGIPRTGSIEVTSASGQINPRYPNSISSFAHWAVGGGWDTTILLLNPTNGVAQVVGMGISGEMGASMLLRNPSAPFQSLNSYSFLTPHSVTELDASGAGTVLTQTGSVSVTGDSAIAGLLRFRYEPTGQEGIVSLETRDASSYVLAFDNTGGIATGVAIANVASNTANIPVIIRDNTGAQIGSGTIPLAGDSHTAFVLSTQC